MEAFGIALSLPVAFATSAVYCAIIGRLVKPGSTSSMVLFLLSILVLVLWMVEFLGVMMFGATSVNEAVGGIYYSLHLVLFFFAVPALATILQLQRVYPSLAKWYYIAPVCTGFALIVVLLQYGVSEALFGID